MEMPLENKNAVIYGGGGAIGGAVARIFAREGASVFLAGRTREKLEAVAGDIEAAGGSAEASVLDALDERAVDGYVDAVVQRAGSIDISFNLISYDDLQGTPLAEMELDDFERPVVNAIRTQFLTSRAAARHMIRQGSGVILTFGGEGGRDPIRDYTSGGFQVYLGGFQVALGALDVLRRQLAVELGPHGIRVVTLQSGGVPETTREDWREAITQNFMDTSMLRRVETLDDLGNVAAFAASDLAGTMTATAINITAGRVAD
jgi:NAD(P)-dependent dehydrogenase (short-subunit alcohol dehydrogenase family)